MESTDLPEEVKSSLRDLGKSLSSIESAIAPLLSLDVEEVSDKLSPTENARLRVTLSYALNSLFYMYLKTHGVAPQQHPVKKELLRVQQYLKKVQAAAKKKQEEKSEALIDERKTVVNKEAAARMVKHALAGNEKKADTINSIDVPSKKRALEASSTTIKSPSKKKKRKTNKNGGKK